MLSTLMSRKCRRFSIENTTYMSCFNYMYDVNVGYCLECNAPWQWPPCLKRNTAGIKRKKCVKEEWL